MPTDLDPSDRAAVLQIIDQGFAGGPLASGEREAILSVSCQNVKLSGRFPPEELILRLPLMHVASCTYVRDDSAHLVLLHHCPQGQGHALEATALTVLSVDCRMSAEEVCALLRQSFQLLYEEATMQFFDRQVSGAPVEAKPTPQEGLQDYMAELHRALPASGMNELATRLRQWKAGHCAFRAFLQHLLQLFSAAEAGPSLLQGLRPFVPPQDVPVSRCR